MKSTRLALVWSLSFLLAFEPAAMAAGKSSSSEDLKKFIETSQITKKSQSLKEFLNANAGVLPAPIHARMLEVANDYPDVVMPKMDVTKIKGPDGEEQLQLTGIHEGQAVSVVVVDNKTTAVKINGQAYSPAEVQDMEIYFTKAGAPSELVNKYFSNRNPAEATAGILSGEQIKKLSLKEKQIYFKQFRELLQSIEAVQQSLPQRKTTSLENSNDFFYSLITGSAAIADVNEPCVAGGHAAVTVKNAKDKGREYCGFNGGSANGGYVNAAMYEGCENEPVRSIRCNKEIYGARASSKVCAPAGRDTTKYCNEHITSKDIPDDKDLENAPFLELQRQASAQAALALRNCFNVTHKILGMQQDQGSGAPETSPEQLTAACGELNKRKALIDSWNCNPNINRDFYVAHSPPNGKICPATPAGPTPPPPATTTTTVPANPPPNGGIPGDKIICANLGNNMIRTDDPKIDSYRATCRANKTGTDWGNMECLDEQQKAHDVTVCNCEGGVQVVGKMKCPAVTGGTGTDGGKDPKDLAKERKRKQGIKDRQKWGWAILAGVLAGGFIWWASKEALKSQYEKINPVVPQPPVPPPQAPAPRVVQ